MKLEDAVSIIAHDFDKSFDQPFKEKVRLQVISSRAVIIKRDLDKARKVDDSLINVIENLPITKESSVKGWFKTNCPIPKPIRLNSGNSIFSVGSSLTDAYTEIDPIRINLLCHDLWGKKCCSNFYFYRNGEIHASSNKPITIQMIAGDPTEFSEFIEGCTEGTACNYDPEAFISEDMFDGIKKVIFETMLDPKLSKEIKINDKGGIN